MSTFEQQITTMAELDNKIISAVYKKHCNVTIYESKNPFCVYDLIVVGKNFVHIVEIKGRGAINKFNDLIFNVDKITRLNKIKEQIEAQGYKNVSIVAINIFYRSGKIYSFHCDELEKYGTIQSSYNQSRMGSGFKRMTYMYSVDLSHCRENDIPEGFDTEATASFDMRFNQ